METMLNTVRFISGSALDVLPIALFLFLFQRIVIGRPMPNARQILLGFGFVVIGLGLFLVGLEQSLFPLGRLMAQQLTNPEFLTEMRLSVSGALVWQDFYWVYLFAAAIGFSTISGLPLHYFIAGGYLVVILQTIVAPKLIVPLVTALGLGLAEAVPGRSPLLDGFGLVAFASLFPIIAVLAFGQLAVLRDRVTNVSEGDQSNKEEESHAL